MTPEQIERVMELIERYGGESYAAGKAVNADTKEFYEDASEDTLAEIEAELKGGGTE